VVIKWVKHSFLLHLSCVLLKKRNIDGGGRSIRSAATTQVVDVANRMQRCRDAERRETLRENSQLRAPGVMMVIRARGDSINSLKSA
jgi:hypothetical protein